MTPEALRERAIGWLTTHGHLPHDLSEYVAQYGDAEIRSLAAAFAALVAEARWELWEALAVDPHIGTTTVPCVLRARVRAQKPSHKEKSS